MPLDLPRYLLGVGEITWLAGFATLGGAALRARLLPSFEGAPALLGTALLGIGLLIVGAQVLGTFGLFEPVPYLAVVGLVGAALRLRLGGGRGAGTERYGWSVATLIALAIAAVALAKFGLEAKPKLSSGMTGFDSTWYHGPFAAGFFQSGNTWDLHFIAPQFLAWFYPANAELFHAGGMLAFGRDLLSPLLNLGWFAGCLLACWCLGRPYGVAPWSLALGAVALSLPVLSDQAGEARNDIVGTFFLLAAVAIALNAWASRPRGEGLETGALIVVGLAAGLAAGTKLNFLLPAVVLVLDITLVVPAGLRWRAFGVATLAAFFGGGYWYLRNLFHSGNPLPWFTDVGPVTLPGPAQELGGREGHSVLSYLLDGGVWSDWFLPGLSEGLTALWPLFLLLALAGLVVSAGHSSSSILRVVGLVGLAAAFAWLIAPTSASGPDGMPRGFESGLRYLAPALVLGLTLAPAVLSTWLRRAGMGSPPNGRILKLPVSLDRQLSGRGTPHARPAALALIAAVIVAIGYPVQRHYLENRYTDPTFADPGLNAAFAWAQGITDSRIATTTTRQYPLFGPDLSNQVQFIGEPRPHGGFVAPTTCQAWRRLIAAGNYGYVVASRDRLEPTKPAYPASAAWTEAAASQTIVSTPPTKVFKLTLPQNPSACSR